MAMRPRGRSGSQPPRQPLRQTYETFRPKSEWKDENEAMLLLIHLPGFLKNQVNMTFTYGDNVTLLKVQGQRPIATGRWSSFTEVFKIPETCEASKITSQFENGVLTVTMPKMVAPKQPDTIVAEDQAQTKREGPSSQETAAQSSQDKISSAAPEVAKTAAAAAMENQREGKDAISQKATSEDKSQKGAQDKTPAVPKAAPPQKPTSEEKTQEGTQDQNFDEKKDVIPWKPPVQDKETTEKSKGGGRQSPEGAPEAVAPKIEEKDKGKKAEDDVEEKSKEDSIAGKSKDLKDESGGAKEVEGGGLEQAEERQLLINMGTALLTLMALVAYVSYSIGRKV